MAETHASKVCARCGIEKPRSAFREKRNRKRGRTYDITYTYLTSYCKVCEAAYKKRWRKGDQPDESWWSANKERLELERFREKCEVDNETGCWNWTGKLNESGYGRLAWKGHQRAHRYSYTKFKGPIPEGMVVCHRCDNPKCVNPDHLWAGTGDDNMADMEAKGRRSRGAKNRHKISVEKAHEILRDSESGMASREAAKKHGVAQGSVLAIRRRATWHFKEPWCSQARK